MPDGPLNLAAVPLHSAKPEESSGKVSDLAFGRDAMNTAVALAYNKQKTIVSYRDPDGTIKLAIRRVRRVGCLACAGDCADLALRA